MKKKQEKMKKRLDKMNSVSYNMRMLNVEGYECVVRKELYEWLKVHPDTISRWEVLGLPVFRYGHYAFFPVEYVRQWIMMYKGYDPGYPSETLKWRLRAE